MVQDVQEVVAGVKFSREWAMPSPWTFTIAPIGSLIARYVGDGRGWADPFAGRNSPAEFRNDLDPEAPAEYHLDAIEFGKIVKGPFKGVLFDPPYSPRQIAECYKGLGLSVGFEDTQLSRITVAVKNALAPKINPGGMAISCNWNSTGFGVTRGFRLIEVLLVSHGEAHNDTIVTVEQKIQTNFDLT